MTAPLRALAMGALAALSLSALGCPGPQAPTRNDVAISGRPAGGYWFSVPGEDGQPRDFAVLLGPDVGLAGLGGNLEVPDGSVDLPLTTPLGATSLNVMVSGTQLYVGGLDSPPLPPRTSGAPGYGWVVLASGQTVPIDPDAEGPPIWVQTWEGKDPEGELLRVELVSSLAFPKVPLRVSWSRGEFVQPLTVELGQQAYSAWPGKSPQGFGSLRFDFEKGLATGEWKLSSDGDPGPQVELKLTRNGPWTPGESGETAPVGSQSG